jgi:hypothetical protein
MRPRRPLDPKVAGTALLRRPAGESSEAVDRKARDHLRQLAIRVGIFVVKCPEEFSVMLMVSGINADAEV